MGLFDTQGTAGPEVDGGSQDMRETWMLLEYADRGNLDRALVQKKMMSADNCLDLVSILAACRAVSIPCHERVGSSSALHCASHSPWCTIRTASYT